MQPMKKKCCVWINQSGFTLLEAIFSIFILTAIMSLLPLMYQWFSAIERSVSIEEDFQWNIFLIQLRDELDEVDSGRLGTERIYLLKNNIPVKYERYKSSVRRQVSGKGHEVVLQNVEKFDVREEGPMLLIHVEFTDGTKEEARFLMPPREEEVIFLTNVVPSYPSH